ncbi:MAG: hypothetical protein ABW128_02730 [Rhizorhabdus sp.]
METIEGIWTTRFGLFGTPDADMRGGAILLSGDRIFGADDKFLYFGDYDLQGTALAGHLKIVRHSKDQSYLTIYNVDESEYEVDYVGELMSVDTFEGRLLRGSYPDRRFVIHRIGDCPTQHEATPPEPLPAILAALSAHEGAMAVPGHQVAGLVRQLLRTAGHASTGDV